MIHPEAVENGGIEIADVDGIFDDVVGVIIGHAVAGASFDTTASDPCAEAAAVVIAARTELPLAVDGAAKLAAPNNQRIF